MTREQADQILVDIASDKDVRSGSGTDDGASMKEI